jgi:ABC-type microcin C transport system permease subunit YejB
VLLSLVVFGGVIAIEYVFFYPVLGLLTVRAIKSQDFPLLQGLFLLFSAVVIVANLVARHPVHVPRPESQVQLTRPRCTSADRSPPGFAGTVSLGEG